MHAGLLDVLHNAADHDGFAIRQSIHIHFDRFLEELIDQHRPRGPQQRGLRHVLLHRLQIVSDYHGAPAKHVAGPHQYWQADLFGHTCGFLRSEGRAIARLRNLQFVQQAPETPPVFGQIDRFGRRPDDGHTVRL